ncbi:dienelactone hydrolase family protein [Brevundimonas sp. 2R-24]|uniref:Dienelactone hydrolase family protein n=1 Tax=Peiella sedimenti TaxID=3061083 RepID=A0ABT8SN96_9CAUL|nr:dienelactone hydrolase family protein [Caulobacteraceae bacterium XZ-24]
MCLPDECEQPARRTLLGRLAAIGAISLVTARARAANFLQPITTEEVTFPTSVGAVGGYLATPQSEQNRYRGAVVILHGEFGLPASHRLTADELAQAGFAALAVRRFSRQPGMTSGDLWRDDQGEGRYRTEAYVREELAETAGAADFLLATCPSSERIGVVGFCGGGIRAVRYAARDPRVAAAVSFYGAPRLEARFKTASDPALDLLEIEDPIRAPVQMHYGLNDYVVKPADIEALAARIRAAGGLAEDYAYEGAGHAFYDRTNPQSYAASAAALARERYLDFLAAHLT